MKEAKIPRYGRVIARPSNERALLGTAIWYDRMSGAHVLALDQGFRCIQEDELEFLGASAPAAQFLGAANEISFDLVGPGSGPFAEGCLRRPGTFWECFFVRPVEWVEGTPWLPRITTGEWQSGITGHLVEVPIGFDCDHRAVAQQLAELLHVDEFQPARGPDSLWLK
jgi:hypothetical protein